MTAPSFHLMIFIVSTSLLSTGCMKQEALPVSDEKIVKVLADVHLAESVLVTYTDPQRDSLATVFYRQIMAIHDMDREVFDTCLAILRRNPERMTEVYDKVLEQLEKEKLGSK